jgi:triacylglycerol lipase
MIADLSFAEQSLLFAKLSFIAYSDPDTATAKFADLGYESVFLDHASSEAYCLYDTDDIIIACRGTQPTELADIIADIKFALVPSSSGVGKVHHGFKQSVDNLWNGVQRCISTYGTSKSLYLTGHSLGAAMATLMATRCARLSEMTTPAAIYTYGSPKVGDATYKNMVMDLSLVHHRWVNNADVVTRNPIWPYKHGGERHYMNHYGDIRDMTSWQITKDRFRGFLVGIKKGEINFYVNHSIERYIDNLTKFVESEK